MPWSRRSASCGLLLIVILVVLFGNPAIVAFGVLGAVVSRLVAFFQESTDTDHKYNWVVLFLVPIVGGLSAYGGVLLVDAMTRWDLLGDTFGDVAFGGESATVPTMAVAFLFGFAERLLDNVAGKAVDGLTAVTEASGEQSAPETSKGAATAAEAQSGTDTEPATEPDAEPGAAGPEPTHAPAHRPTRGRRARTTGHLPRGLRG